MFGVCGLKKEKVRINERLSVMVCMLKRQEEEGRGNAGRKFMLLVLWFESFSN